MKPEFVIDVFGMQFDGFAAAGLIHSPLVVTFVILALMWKWIM